MHWVQYGPRVTAPPSRSITFCVAGAVPARLAGVCVSAAGCGALGIGSRPNSVEPARIPRGERGCAGRPLGARMMGTMTCVFCEIVAGDAPAQFVHRSGRASAFLPRAGWLRRGHTLVIPDRHSTGVHDAGSDDLAATVALVQEVSLAMRAQLEGSGWWLRLRQIAIPDLGNEGSTTLKGQLGLPCRPGVSKGMKPASRSGSEERHPPPSYAASLGGDQLGECLLKTRSFDGRQGGPNACSGESLEEFRGGQRLLPVRPAEVDNPEPAVDRNVGTRRPTSRLVGPFARRSAG